MTYVFLTLTLFAQYLIVRYVRFKGVIYTGTFVILVFSILATFRGAVGTDTHSYRRIVDLFLQGVEIGVEPGFYFFVYLFGSIFESSVVISNLFSLFFFTLLIIFMLRATRNQLLYFFGYFAPQYFIMYSMNGLRIGIATAFFLLFYQSFVRGERFLIFLFSLCSLFFHVSIIFAYVVFFVLRSQRINIAFIARQMALLFFVFIFIFYFKDRFFSLADTYSDGQTVTEGSAGLSFMFKQFVFIPFLFSLPLPRAYLFKVVLFIIVFYLSFFVASQYSYAGLRFMDIFTWLMPLVLLSVLPNKEKLSHNFFIGLGLSGFLGALFVLRNIFSSEGVGLSPFLPYHFLGGIF